ncbi:MAG: hypothetical protein ABIH59_01165 [archaeon]
MNSENKEKILATIVLEILGKPPEHLVEILVGIIKELGGEKGISIKSERINEPHPAKEIEGIYSSFAEIEIETKGIEQMIAIMFKYMPSHIEIMSPENIGLSKNSWNELFNELSRRLHAYDEVARIIQNEKVILENKLKELKNKK